jgi:hypothetical protein
VCVCLVCSVCVYLCVCAEEGEKDWINLNLFSVFCFEDWSQ